MTAIAHITATLIRIPTIRPHALSMATMTDQRSVIVAMEADDGMTGYGEAATIGGLTYAEECPDGIKLVIDAFLAPELIGLDLDYPGKIMARLASAGVGNYFAKMALETALLDLAGQRRGLPISEMLGGRICDSLPVLWTLASGDTTADIDEARRMTADGRGGAFKLKIGRRAWRDDVAHAAAIAAALPEASIRVDVNQAWDLTTARRAIPALGEAGIALVEQPLRASDLDGAQELRAHGGPPLMADEALRGGPAQAMHIARSRAADVFSLKIGQAGGAFACATVAAMARACGIGLYGGSMLEGAIGTVASAHVFATISDLVWGTELFGPLLLTGDILESPLEYSAHGLVVPDGPGLGISVDTGALAEAARRDAATTTIS